MDLNGKEAAMSAPYGRIICAVDGSELSTKALQQALTLTTKLGGTLTVVTVTEPSYMIAPGAEAIMIDTGSIIAELDKAKADSAKVVLADAEKVAASTGARVSVLHVAGKPPAEGIIDAAKELAADLIIMGSHGRRGLGRLLLGSQAAEVLAHSSIPVLVVK